MEVDEAAGQAVDQQDSDSRPREIRNLGVEAREHRSQVTVGHFLALGDEGNTISVLRGGRIENIREVHIFIETMAELRS
jgi:hypothetical protein